MSDLFQTPVVSASELARIEARARVLRAEAARDGWRYMSAAISNAVAGLFGRHSTAS